MSHPETPVLLRVKGIQSEPNSEPEVIELLTHGTISQQGEGLFRLSYEETSMTGLEGTQTTFEVAPDSVSLRRSGTFNSHMLFQLGCPHHTQYETPYGAIAMNIRTLRLHSTLTQQGGELELEYAIEYDHGHVGDHAFHITVSPNGTL